jgi:spore coat-associated protein N
MSRMKALWSASPRKVLAGLFAVLAAASIAVGSGANFNSASANPSNVFSGGTLAQSNSKTGAAILTASGLKPGGTATGTVDIANTGSVTGAFTLTKSAAVDTPTGTTLSTKLTVVITDQGDPTCTVSCPAPATVYSGTLAGMGPITLGNFAANAKHRYQFVVTFPDSGTQGGDNAYQGASTTVDYSFTAAS